jgi:Tfp pilus assembly protein PilF
MNGTLLTRRGVALLLGTFLCATFGGSQDDWKKKDRARDKLIRARRLAAEYKMDRAASEAREALKNDPSLAEAYVYLGLDKMRDGNAEQAQAEFRKALEIDAYNAAAHCYLGYIFYERGDHEDALDEWTLATKLDPTSPHAHAGYALAQFRRGEKDLAARAFEKALTYDRRFADLKFLGSDKGPKWSLTLLKDAEQLLPLVTKPNYPY